MSKRPRHTVPDLETFLTSSRHPFQLFTLFLAVLTGIPLLIGEAKPGSLAALLPNLLENVWAVLLSGGAAVALVGVWWRDRPTGLIIEQVGLLSCGFACLIYLAAALIAVGFSAAAPGAIVGGFGASCIWRYVQIEKVIRIGTHRRG